MTRLLVGVSVVLTGLLTVAVLLVRAQPYDDLELRALLTPPEECPAPCFMGITLGVTTIDEALALLERHNWIDHIEQMMSQDGHDYYQIFWNTQRPAIIDEQARAYLKVEANEPKHVGMIFIPIEATRAAGELLTFFDQPALMAVDTMLDLHGGEFVGLYVDYIFMNDEGWTGVQTRGFCPGIVQNTLFAHFTGLMIGSKRYPYYETYDYLVESWPDVLTENLC